MRMYSEKDVFSLGYRRAADALEDALAQGFDPSNDPERCFTEVPAGEFLTMPSSVGNNAGIKILTLAPENPAKGAPYIQGTYLLCDATTLTPHSLVDGISLTALRTPSVAIAAARPALRSLAAHVTNRPRVLVFGAGVQGEGLVRALLDECGPQATRFSSFESVTYAVRNPQKVSASALEVGQREGAKSAEEHESESTPQAGAVSSVGQAGSVSSDEQELDPRPHAGAVSSVGVVESGSDACHAAVAAADIIVCASAAREPLFRDEDLQSHAVVLAVGAHTPETREVPGETMARAHVIIEDRAVAMRENGDVVLAINEGNLREDNLVSMKELLGEGGVGQKVFGTPEQPIAPERPTVVTTVGMSWQDLVVAAAVAEGEPSAR